MKQKLISLKFCPLMIKFEDKTCFEFFQRRVSLNIVQRQRIIWRLDKRYNLSFKWSIWMLTNHWSVIELFCFHNHCAFMFFLKLIKNGGMPPLWLWLTLIVQCEVWMWQVVKLIYSFTRPKRKKTFFGGQIKAEAFG